MDAVCLYTGASSGSRPEYRAAAEAVGQEIARAVMDLGGPDVLVDGSRPALLWCQSMWETIGGGTSEVMRGVVAKQGLRLGGRRPGPS